MFFAIVCKMLMARGTCGGGEMTSQECSAGLGMRLVCLLKDGREQAESLGACVSQNWVKLKDQDSCTRQGHKHSRVTTLLEGCFKYQKWQCRSVLANPLLWL